MEKKKNIWVGKIVVIVLIIVSIGSYYVFPSVKHVMNQVFRCLLVETLQWSETL